MQTKFTPSTFRVRPAAGQAVPPSFGAATEVVVEVAVVVVVVAAATVVKLSVPSELIPPNESLVETLSKAVASINT